MFPTGLLIRWRLLVVSSQTLTAKGFDAGAIADLAVEAEMEYITFTTKHHDSFCLFDSAETGFTSVDACGRDLVGELADACRERGLGLFLYYSHGRDWRYPHAPNNDEWAKGSARPEYDKQPGIYADAGHNLGRYLDFVSAQVEELCSGYGPIAGVWFDGWIDEAEVWDLLLNTAPLPDGSLGPTDAATLRAVGDRIRSEGVAG